MHKPNEKDLCITHFQYLADMVKHAWDYVCITRIPVDEYYWNMRLTPFRSMLNDLYLCGKELLSYDPDINLAALLDHQHCWFYPPDEDLQMRGILQAYINGNHSRSLVLCPLRQSAPGSTPPSDADRQHIFDQLAPHIFQHHGIDHHFSPAAHTKVYRLILDAYPRHRELFMNAGPGGEHKLALYEQKFPSDLYRAVTLSTNELDPIDDPTPSTSPPPSQPPSQRSSQPSKRSREDSRHPSSRQHSAAERRPSRSHSHGHHSRHRSNGHRSSSCDYDVPLRTVQRPDYKELYGSDSYRAFGSDSDGVVPSFRKPTKRMFKVMPRGSLPTLSMHQFGTAFMDENGFLRVFVHIPGQLYPPHLVDAGELQPTSLPDPATQIPGLAPSTSRRS